MPFDEKAYQTAYRKTHKTKAARYAKEWHAKNFDRRNELSRKSRYKKAGLTIDDYERLHEHQKGLCAVCERPERTVDPRNGRLRLLAVDHNHMTGRVRELLCRQCNTALGLLGEDSSRILAMFDYVIKHNGK